MLNLEDNHHPTMITQPIVSPIESNTTNVVEDDQNLAVEDEPFVVKKYNLDEDDSEVSEPISINSNDLIENDDLEANPDGKIRFYLEDEEISQEENVAKEQSWDMDSPESKVEKEPTVEENKELTEQRLNRIKKESQKMKSPMGITELENEPAYKRRNIQLDDFPRSEDSSVSKFTLGKQDDQQNNLGLNGNNSFLHDNVD